MPLQEVLPPTTYGRVRRVRRQLVVPYCFGASISDRVCLGPLSSHDKHPNLLTRSAMISRLVDKPVEPLYCVKNQHRPWANLFEQRRRNPAQPRQRLARYTAGARFLLTMETRQTWLALRRSVVPLATARDHNHDSDLRTAHSREGIEDARAASSIDLTAGRTAGGNPCLAITHRTIAALFVSTPSG